MYTTCVGVPCNCMLMVTTMSLPTLPPTSGRHEIEKAPAAVPTGGGTYLHSEILVNVCEL